MTLRSRWVMLKPTLSAYDQVHLHFDSPTSTGIVSMRGAFDAIGRVYYTYTTEEDDLTVAGGYLFYAMLEHPTTGLSRQAGYVPCSNIAVTSNLVRLLSLSCDLSRSGGKSRSAG